MKKNLTLNLAGFLLASAIGIQVTKAQPTTASYGFHLNQSTAGLSYIFHTNNNDYTNPYIMMRGNAVGGRMSLVAGYHASTQLAHEFMARDINGGTYTLMQISRSGLVNMSGALQVGGTTTMNGAATITGAAQLNSTAAIAGAVRIGVQAPASQHTDYKLAVDGKLVAKSIYVTAPSTWADFVFAPNYRYMPLPELEAYLRVNKHLPSMPSAQEVEANGYNVNEMDAKLLQNVEELTLRLIELSKQNERLQAEVAELRTKMAKE